MVSCPGAPGRRTPRPPEVPATGVSRLSGASAAVAGDRACDAAAGAALDFGVQGVGEAVFQAVRRQDPVEGVELGNGVLVDVRRVDVRDARLDQVLELRETPAAGKVPDAIRARPLQRELEEGQRPGLLDALRVLAVIGQRVAGRGDDAGDAAERERPGHLGGDVQARRLDRGRGVVALEVHAVGRQLEKQIGAEEPGARAVDRQLGEAGERRALLGDQAHLVAAREGEVPGRPVAVDEERGGGALVRAFLDRVALRRNELPVALEEGLDLARAGRGAAPGNCGSRAPSARPSVPVSRR